MTYIRHPGPKGRNRRNVAAKPGRPDIRHPDCRYCKSAELHLDRQVVAGGRLRMEVMDLKAEVKRYRRVMSEHYSVPWVRELLGGERCAHGVSLQGRCSYCGVFGNERI